MVTASSNQVKGASLWMADSEDRDFRDETFVKKELNAGQAANLDVAIDYPSSGFRAFYVDLIYSDPNGGEYIKSTRMFVADEDEVFVD